MSVIPYAFLIYLVAAAVLFLAAIVSGTPLRPYPADEFLLFLALAAVSTIFGHTVLNWSLRHLPAAFVSLSMLGEPVGASILACLLLSEAPGPGTLAGGAMVMAGILLTAGGAPSGDRTPDR